MPPRKTATDKTVPEQLNQELVPGATLTRVNGEFLAQDLAYGEDSFLSAIRRADGTVVPLGELTETEQRQLAAFLEIEGATTLQGDLLLSALKAERLPSTLGAFDGFEPDDLVYGENNFLSGIRREDGAVIDLLDLTEARQRRLATFLNVQAADTLPVDQLLIALQSERMPSALGASDPLVDGVHRPGTTVAGGVLTETLSLSDAAPSGVAAPMLDQRLAVDPAGGAARAINLPQTRDLEAEAAAQAAAEELLERDNTFLVNRELLEHDGIPFTFGDEVVITDQREAVALLTIGAITRPAK